MRPLTTPPFEFRTTVYSRSNGDSACAKAAYRSASCILDERTGRVWDFRAKEAVVATDILAPSGAPAWCQDRAALWNRAEAAEGTRKNAQVAREVRLTLPRDLSLEQMRALVEQHIQGAYVSHGMVADYAIHAPDARDGEEHFHVHILLTQRQLDPDTLSGFAAKKGKASFNHVFADEFKNGAAGKFAAGDTKITQLRAVWAAELNAALALAGSQVRVDPRTNAEQREEALESAADPARPAAERDWYEARADILSLPPEEKLGNRAGGRRRAKTEKLRAERAAKIRHWEAELPRRAEARADKHRTLATPWPKVTPAAPSPSVVPPELPAGEHRRRRRDRAVSIRDSWPAMAAADEQAAKQRFKLQLLAAAYEAAMPDRLAVGIAWVRARDPLSEIVVQIKGGARIRDDGRRIAAQGETDDRAIEVMVEMAKARGWRSVKLQGSQEFKAAAAEALARARLRAEPKQPAGTPQIGRQASSRPAGWHR